MKRTIRITTKAVFLLPVKDHQYCVFDSELTGLGICVSPGGKKSCFVKFKADGKRVRRVFGSVPPLNGDEARGQAREIMAKAALGLGQAVVPMTLQEGHDLWWRRHVTAHLSPSTQHLYSNTWRWSAP